MANLPRTVVPACRPTWWSRWLLVAMLAPVSAACAGGELDGQAAGAAAGDGGSSAKGGSAGGGGAGAAGKGGNGGAGAAGAAGNGGNGGAGAAGKGGSGGAGKGGAGNGGAGNGGAGGATVIGKKDNPANASVSVSEPGIRGEVSGTKVKVIVPTSAVGGPAKGTLGLKLQKVDGSATLDTATLAYDLAAGATQDVAATISLPTGLTAQAATTEYVVVVDDGQDGGLRVARSLHEVLGVYEVLLEGPATATQGKKATFRVRARDPRSKKPLAGVPVKLAVTKAGAQVSIAEGVTGPNGDFVFQLAPDSGDFQLATTGAVQGTETTVSSPFVVKAPGARVFLTTDKPIYQPGQVIHLRALALAEQANTPLSGSPAVFEVADGKGNKIMKRTATTDAHGIASTDFAIGSVVNMGTFKITSTVGPNKGEKSVSVSRYSLPKFKVGIQTTKPWYRAGDVVDASIDAAYFFGKPVGTGDVLIEASTLDIGQTVFQKIQTKTDAAGKTSFSITLPQTLIGLPLDNGNALVNLRATVTDTAGQQVKQDRLLTVSQDGTNVALIPESTALVPGVENHLDLFATDPLGAPLAAASVDLALPGGAMMAATTDEFGWAGFAWTPGANPPSTTVTATVKIDGQPPATSTFNFNQQNGKEHVVVRTDKSVYDAGDTVTVSVATTEPSSQVYVDWINGGQTVDMRSLQAKDGVASFTMGLDAGLLGANRIEAYIVDSIGNVVRSGRTVFARKGGSLSVQLTTDQPQYEPGQEAKLTFQVADEGGNPAAAALGVQIVDEAVFALSESTPGLLKTYFELEDAYAKPAYEIHGPTGTLDELLFTKSSDPKKAQAAQVKAGAAFAALGDKVPAGIQLASWAATLAGTSQTLAPYALSAKASLLPALSAAAQKAQAALSAQGCVPTSFYCGNQPYVAAFSQQLSNLFVAYDFWGNAYVAGAGYNSIVLSSSGPDEQPSSGDELPLQYVASELGVQLYGGAGGSSGAGGASAGGGAAGSGTTGGSSGGEEPRVRKDFPETLYVNPALITGADGKATITVPMADSITTWRVSSLANTQSGKLGGGVAGIKVFQDFFVDMALPATMTRGDEVTFPIAVYNYLDTPETVTLTLQPGDWFTPLGTTQLSVTLAPGEVKGVQVPVRALKVGVGTLTAKAVGSKKSDAVARTVLVVPDGKEIAKATSGALAPGAATLSAVFPAEATPGSGHLHLDLYPAFLSQAVSGMDSLLQTPNGCFEQTTSSTWPNVLVSRYMKKTGQITPAIALKAESLISVGYQRLLTFEHPGGGFSWFGTQDPKPFLSVTAFGVMEFADMAEVASVDPAMIARTKTWLANQQQPDGSWEGDQTEFFSFQTSTVRNTAFVAWALASAGTTGGPIDAALAYVKTHLGASEDAYTLGIVANAFALGAPSDPYTATLLAQLDAKKTVNGDQVYWSTAGTQTDFYGSGKDADVTATALAAHALMSFGGYAGTVQGALSFLVASRDTQGNFGSTQATIWTLRALLLAAEKGTGDAAVGNVDVAVDGAPFTTVTLTKEQNDVLSTVDLSSLATTGTHDVTLTFAGTGKLSYGLVAKHNVPWATGAEPPGPIAIDVAYDKTTLVVNETASVTVTVTNTQAVTQNMVMLTLGVPPGFEVVSEDLDAYVKSGVLSAYEPKGKQLDLYVSKLSPSAKLVLTYRVRATMPVKAEDGGAKAYPYYQPSAKSTATSTKLEVVN